MPEKLICLMRHSEAAVQLSETITSDFDKPLTDHGIHQLEFARNFLKAHHFLPDLILCSPAVRTRQTLEWIQEALGTGAEVVFDEELYGIKSEALIQKIGTLTNKKSTVLVVGHNPSISDMMQNLLNRADNSKVVVGLPAKPAQLAIFRLKSNSWAHITKDEVCVEAAFDPGN